MKFFMPGESPEDAETLYQGFRESYRSTDARIYSITFRDGKKEVKATVGKPDPLEGRMVMAILETNGPYRIWAKGRGFNHMMVGKDEVTTVEKFESPGRSEEPK
jgi:hypothetical protein